MDLAELCYVITAKFPADERFGMTSQIRRAAASIAANIAEGNGRGTTQDYIRFLRIAQGSLKETETHLILAHRVGLLDKGPMSDALELGDRIGRMLVGLIRSLSR